MASLLSLASLEIEHAKTEMAVGYERTHAEFFGQGEGLPVVGLCQRDFSKGVRLLHAGQPVCAPPPGRDNSAPDRSPFPLQWPAPWPARAAARHPQRARPECK